MPVKFRYLNGKEVQVTFNCRTMQKTAKMPIHKMVTGEKKEDS